jgi:hypothetical protein
VTFPYIHVLYSELIHSLHYSPLYPFPFLMVSSTGFSVLCSYLYSEYITHIHPPYPLHLPSPPTCAFPLSWPVLYSHTSWFRCLFVVQWKFCIGILPVNFLCLSQSPPLLFLTLFPHPVLFNSLQRVSLYPLPTQMAVFYYYYFLSFLLFLLPQSLLTAPF